MGIFHTDKEKEALSGMKDDVKEYEKGINEEQKELKDLFLSIKTDLLDEILAEGKIKQGYLGVLEEQVKHVLGIARTIKYPELIRSFEEEEKVLGVMRGLIHDYPNVSLESSPDLKASLEDLRTKLKHQQGMIFDHEQILKEEKMQLVEILRRVNELKRESEVEHKIGHEGPEDLH